MTARLLVVLVAGLMMPVSAFAERARETAAAEMAELDEQGTPMPLLVTYRLALVSANGRPTSLTLTETFGSKCPPGAVCIMGHWERTTEFRVARVTAAGCGSRSIHAVHRESVRGKRKLSRLTLLDHTQRACDDAKPFAWEATLERADEPVRRLGGTPEPAKPQDDCASVAQDTACITLFQPATCSLSALNGDAIEPPLSAQGSNPCFAAAELRVAACRQGLAWKQISDDDLECSLAAVEACPALACAAPPPGCRYEPDGLTDPNGCATSCGRVVCDGPDPR